MRRILPDKQFTRATRIVQRRPLVVYGIRYLGQSCNVVPRTGLYMLRLVYAPTLGGDFMSPSRQPTPPPYLLALFTLHPSPLRLTERFVLRLVSFSSSVRPLLRV